ncbi:SRPBCC domain-containing protein [Streptomyces sp. NPDC017993]|uniref:SRPBCC domain-containing protein n=1 Tax=Streptomyces sp. NPDC017993 TaxID=3365027 RepID=UPI003795C228
MEHEVYVPFPVGTVRQALTEPARVARCVPGVQLDADAAPQSPEGRLRLRVGSATITYRGTLKVTVGKPNGAGDADPADPVTVEVQGTEARGDGSATLMLTVRLSSVTEPDPGTTLTCAGKVSRDGRLAEVTDQAARTAGRRLLDRFAENLAADLEKRPVDGTARTATAAASGAEGVSGPEASEEAPGEPTDPGAAGQAEPSGGPEAAGGSDEHGEGTPPEGGEAAGRGVFDTEVPPPSLDPLSDADSTIGAFDVGDADEVDDVGDVEEGEGYDGYDDDVDGTPAEAAHARRTMIGRSAEEVDHAPPRGRYAPVPAPEANATSATLRWAAPAAAVVLASAVVVGRVLRRRR